MHEVEAAIENPGVEWVSEGDQWLDLKVKLNVVVFVTHKCNL